MSMKLPAVSLLCFGFPELHVELNSNFVMGNRNTPSILIPGQPLFLISLESSLASSKICKFGHEKDPFTGPRLFLSWENMRAFGNISSH